MITYTHTHTHSRTLGGQSGLTDEQKAMLHLKAQASDLFSGRKKLYPSSVSVPFAVNRVENLETYHAVLEVFEKTRQPDDRDILYTSIVHKVFVTCSPACAPSSGMGICLPICPPWLMRVACVA